MHWWESAKRYGLSAVLIAGTFRHAAHAHGWEQPHTHDTWSWELPARYAPLQASGAMSGASS
jgi:hypothetical protein